MLLCNHCVACCVTVEESSEFLGAVDPLPVVPNPPENVPKTKFHPPLQTAHFTYNRVVWKLNVRKEVSSVN